MTKKKNISKKMTNAEKALLLSGNGSWFTYGIERLGIKPVEMHDGPLGLRWVDNNPDFNLKESKEAVCFPAPCLAACSWDVDLERELGRALGREARLKNTQVLLAPGANIKRNPLCGRNFEYLSEDPLVSGKMAAAYINGLQDVNVGACLKHFACNSQEYYRMVNNSIVDERALREIYLKPFEIAVKEADPWAIMASYNKVNGEYACESTHLLQDILKGQWNYKGVVMSDWGAVNDVVASHNNGLDLEMPCMLKNRDKAILRALKKGRLCQEALDESADRLVAFSKKANAPFKDKIAYTMDEGHAIAVKVAEESAVLLKNDGVLPLKNYKDVCFVGEFARTPRYQGGGSSHVCPHKLVSFLDAIKEEDDPEGKRIPFAPGYDFDSSWDDGEVENFIAAVDLASKSKTVVMFLGLPESSETEGLDRPNIHMPEEQLRLFDEIYEVNQNIIVVLSCGAPVEVPFLAKAKAVLLMYLPGEGGGEAIDHLLRGAAVPSGKLAESWPKHISDAPSFGFYPGEERTSLYRESIYVGYRYYLTAGKEVSFPFGHGLSYAKFSLKSLSLSEETLSEGKDVVATVQVSNASSFSAKKVVELYAEPLETGNVFKPKRVLIGFKKVEIPAKTSLKVEFTIKFSDFQIFDLDSSSWKVEGGKVAIEVGDSCEDIVLKKELVVQSEDVLTSERLKMPTYYSPTTEGFLQFENDFEALLGHPIAMERDPKTGPYDLNSTFSDIKRTWLGKLIFNVARKKAHIDEPGKESEKAFFEQTPLRNTIMSGLGPKYSYLIRDFANGKYVSGLFAFLFNTHR